MAELETAKVNYEHELAAEKAARTEEVAGFEADLKEMRATYQNEINIKNDEIKRLKEENARLNVRLNRSTSKLAGTSDTIRALEMRKSTLQDHLHERTAALESTVAELVELNEGMKKSKVKKEHEI